ncbi:hypothetical protein [Candidatus Rariloculus sp.]|uniref:hypothetical protein n=1 Tax=Candidatus Rariloculus sp. TaxID=3101265 RepID=UPI003D115904
MNTHFNDLLSPIEVSFDRLFIDPNNPRIAEDHSSRYDRPDAIFDPVLQERLTTRTYEVYQAKDLHDSIVAQGWIPIDGILVWQHPDRPAHYIVVEGNTRTSVLRTIRGPTLTREQEKLKRLQKGGSVPAEDIRQQEQLVDKLKSIISDTDKLTVFPVNAATVADLEQTLPRLLGVRHISHAKGWGPYEENLYMTQLYRRLFLQRHGPDETFRLEQDLIDQVAVQMTLGSTKTRRNIQAASAFQHFKFNYEDRLPEGEEITNEDHYFFELILQNKYAQEQFEFTKDRLRLPDESENALFLWAFSKPRQRKGEPNENVFYKAENIRLWNTMKRYDDKFRTAFASNFDVKAPDETTTTMSQVEADFLTHKAQRSPIHTLDNLLQALRDLKGETLITQADFLKPALEKISDLSKHYLRMMEADAPR